MKLRPYQLECLKVIEEKSTHGIYRQLVVLPTGAGKTVIFSELIKEKNLKTLVIAHRLELLEQAEAKIHYAAPFIETGIFCGDRRCHDKQVTVASIQSAVKYLDLLKEENYQLLIIDEAHHAAAKSYRTLIKHLGFAKSHGVQKLLVGFTATPHRSDGRGLDEVFQEVVYHISIKKLVNRGYLICPEGLHVTVGIDLRGVLKQVGDFKKEQLQRIMLEEKAINVVTRTVATHASDRRGIVFTVNIQHAEILKERIQALGFTCDTVHSKVSIKDRQERLKAFGKGNLQFITNPMILTEGFDCPRADCMINAAPTLNRSLYVQKAGRVLRIHPEKSSALLIDFGFTKKKHALKTAIDLFGDAKMRKIMDGRELRPHKRTGSELVDFSKVEFEKSEKEKYNPLDPSERFSSNLQWKGGDDAMGRRMFSLSTNGMKLFIRKIDASEQYEVLRYVYYGKEHSREYHGVHGKQEAFEMAESLTERPTQMKNFSNNKWRSEEATDKQIDFLKMLLIRSNRPPLDIDFSNLTKGSAADYIHKLRSCLN